MKAGFIGIGAQKAATTWLHHVLAEHPDVSVADEKEVNFFSAQFDKGYAWYTRRFGGQAQPVLFGECSPNYFISCDATARAKVYNPDLKIIAILRDPIDRAFSNHLHEIRKGHIPASTSFAEALTQNPTYLEQSSYKRHLSRWIEAFGQEQVLVLLSEDIGADPAAAYRDVCAHLGLSTGHALQAVGQRQNESITYRSKKLQKILRQAGDAGRAAGLAEAITWVKGRWGIRQLIGYNRQHLRGQVTEMSPQTRAKLEQYFQDDVAYVSALLGRDALPWSTGRDAVHTTLPNTKEGRYEHVYG